MTPGRLPTFLVIGAQKCATTSLCHALGEHPSIFVSEPKEPHFFSLDEHYERGLDSYMQLFAAAGSAVALGEGSTSYTMRMRRPDAATRIAKALPDAQLIYMVRHPLRRLESAWMHMRVTRRTTRPFAEALRSYPHLLDTTRYFEQLGYYREHYADDRILVLFFEDFTSKQSETLATAFRFLGVEADIGTSIPDAERNVSTGRRADGALLGLLRSHPAVMRAARLLPGPARHVLARSLSEPMTQRPVWTEKDLAWVLDRIAPDTRALLRHAGKPDSFWDLGLLPRPQLSEPSPSEPPAGPGPAPPAGALVRRRRRTSSN